ncbi:MAG: 3'-5' exonuclease [Myxococcota bacterium]|nr:3'-5' exonuclease [Myxococcota bacterium]
MTSPRATWFCIDIEANGPVPGLYDMVSLGATVVFAGPDGSPTLGRDFYMELKPQAPRFDARAAAIHGLDQARLAREGLTRAAAATALENWVQGETRPGTEACFVGHNAPFDWSHVAYLYAELERPNPFGYKALDTKALAAGVLDLHWLDTGKETLFARLGLPPEDTSQKHRADYDARVQAELLRALLTHRT